MKLRHLPPRAATGLVILNSGLGKRHADDDTAAALHGMAKTTYPFLARIPPKTFVRMLSATEIALGTALLLPVVPTLVAAGGLTAFSAGLVGLYLRTPGMRQKGGLRPTEQGIALVKDVWMLGSGLGMLVDETLAEEDGRRLR
ncbi:hypothetical protein GCM10010399_74550 [Dactylosporangium fulvum]|uniref:DoxX family protein n=1 Tax=Dactylosporangium fulvum TaxID=53359 RepID=A0ABY5VPA1_9ACTN|nr:hypothetical protein [Dactylosporangium fulvum]UWP79125.1 hypothetical protein Dfulv_28610 [Dactylosporangium fulvum]